MQWNDGREIPKNKRLLIPGPMHAPSEQGIIRGPVNWAKRPCRSPDLRTGGIDLRRLTGNLPRQ